MNTDEKIIEAMEAHGGAFCKVLARLWKVADPVNKRRVQEAFPDFWDAYRTMVERNTPAPAAKQEGDKK